MVGEIKEKLEEINEHTKGWNKYLALTTALIAVLAAIASLLSGSYANEAVIENCLCRAINWTSSIIKRSIFL